MASSAFSSQVWEYDVFLSFRGIDTRKTFVDHLYSALQQQGIYTYKDEETLPRGESISPALMNAIEKSKIAIIVFSKNYAESSWCLDELVHIMKCKDTIGQTVMPIFYDVEPSEVRKQKLKYGGAFVRHKLENKNKVELWRKAVADASDLSGWEPKHIANGHETKVIKEIIKTILWRLDSPTQTTGEEWMTSEDLIGMNDHVKDLEFKIQFRSGGVRMIGILGVGGSGKTSLASSIYNTIYSNFDGCCYLKNIREESRKEDGVEKLQAKLLSRLLKQKQVEVGRVEEGRHMIMDRLRYKQFLIVLDDVDNLEHLKELAGSRDWFGNGSRIIITTRDEHILTAHGVDAIQNISLLNNDEAIELFRKYAYPRYKPMEDYERSIKDVLSLEVVSYAGGLPLALKVLGSFLFDKDINKWRIALARLILMPDQKSHVHDLVAADMKNRQLIDLNIEKRVQATRSLPENLPPKVQKQRKYCKEDLVDAIIKPLFPNEDLVILHYEAHLKIPLQRIILATNNFSEEHLIARGGFGQVYKAQYEDVIVAIKKLDKRYGQGRPEFMMEVTLLSAYKHENLVSLIGFCEENDEKILVYKYESNASLDQHLIRKDLSWIQRIQICLDAARGLKYLHDDIGIQHRILHRDMKSANILLDENFRAKISDFGLSRIALANVPFTVVISHNRVGTPGYCDPEYFKRGELTQYSDVYSFGVVMFEVLCGKVAAYEPSLAETAQNHYGKGTLDEIIDSDLRNQMNSESLSTFSAIAYQCLKCPGKERPRMVGVVKELEKALDYQEVVSQK